MHSASVKTLKRMLKKAGLKSTGRKAALTRRAKKAHLKMRGGGGSCTIGSTVDGNIATAEECSKAGGTWMNSSEPGFSNLKPGEGGRRRSRGTRKSRRGGGGGTGNHGVQCDPGYHYVHLKGCVKN